MTSAPGGGPSLTDRLFHFGGELAYALILAVVWLVASIPIITIPAATAAVYGTIGVHVVNGSREYVAPFKAAFVPAFTRATWRGLAVLVVGLLTGFNAFYYLRVLDSSGLTLTLGIVQVILAAIALVFFSLFLLLVGLHYARGYRGAPPRLRDVAETVRQFPLAAVVVLAVSIGVPAIAIVLVLWQFAIFIPGVICYLHVWLLMKLHLPELLPNR